MTTFNSKTSETEAPLRVIASVVRHSGGFGFLKAPGQPDVFVPPSFMRKFLGGDEVSYELTNPAAGKKQRTEQALRTCRLLNRTSQPQMGVLINNAGTLLLQADESGLPPMVVEIPQGMEVPLHPDVIVAVKPLAPSGRLGNAPLRGQLVAILGERHAPDTVERYALVKGGFESHREATEPLSSPEWSDIHRVNLKGQRFYAIDDKYTSDVDDALQLQRKKERIVLRVAITDVAAWVTAGSALDKQACLRGTSLYLPGKIAHMFPESLATGLFPLSGEGPKRVVIIEAEYCAKTGTSLTQRAYRAWIDTPVPLTYEEAAQHCETEMSLWAHLEGASTPLLQHPGLRKALAANTQRGLPLSAETRGRRAKEFVEFCMTEANQSAARILQAGQSQGLFRGQQAPGAEKWGTFWKWAEEVGVMPERFFKEGVSALPWGRDRPESQLFVMGMGARLGGARYCSQPLGHYLLEKPSYTHATSPIRRYADLVVQRLLVGDSPAEMPLDALAAHLNTRFRAAVEAERFVVTSTRMQNLKKVADAETAYPAFWLQGLESPAAIAEVELFLPDFGVTGVASGRAAQLSALSARSRICCGQVRVAQWVTRDGCLVPLLDFASE